MRKVVGIIIIIISIILFISAIKSCNGCSSGSSSSSSYTAKDADINFDGEVSGKEFQDLVNDYMDDHGY